MVESKYNLWVALGCLIVVIGLWVGQYFAYSKYSEEDGGLLNTIYIFLGPILGLFVGFFAYYTLDLGWLSSSVILFYSIAALVYNSFFLYGKGCD